MAENQIERKRVRKLLWEEAIRLSNIAEISEFIEKHCVEISESSHCYYEYKGRNKRQRQVILKSIIRDNLSSTIVDDKTPFAWEDTEEKINALEEIIRIVSVPKSKTPWLST